MISAVSDNPPPAIEPRLSAASLACRRGHRVLFQNLDLVVAPGQIVWLRGQNGRGKTSLLKLAAGLSAPEHGQVLCEGRPVRRSLAAQQRLLYIGHANALKEDLTACEALDFLLRIHGRPHGPDVACAALERLGMHSRRHAMVRTLSQGQRRRIALARLAVEDSPSLWLLDEPYDALDADGVARVDALLAGNAERGGSVMLTSHLSLDTARLRPIEIDLDRYAATA
ncbi:cytochrome c biogenesis heme-transporting ATPase CcmA [Piscinibacter sp. XHJ-5]|uniref:cytochrome c biogenesis heme-transporting ATPase CcmA n=1 Tax=Piscinibacter sp. XHJ-5 TaxID=3037797 RepID=UPI0024532B2B|nr:cytochrome c biogenesis heme-transporting ATPase CcmA [Piscinibacter sp. XHJ-5]